MEDSYVSVFSAPDEPTANIVKIALENAGIPAVIKMTYGSKILDGVPAMGEERQWGELFVPSSDAEKACELLEDYANGLGDAGEEEAL